MKYGAIYLRLSKDDNGKNESESIANQRHLLLQYAETNAIPIRFEFSDDGITGTTQNRRGLQSMYRAIEDGLIDTVLVKDLSRLSRNFIHTGELIEEWFPSHKVRLISVDDGIDTAFTSPSNDIFAIRAVLDDWYARDISRKVRAAIYAKQKAGFCTIANLPFGYQRRGTEITTNHSQAEIVKRIYHAYLSGSSVCQIMRDLNHNGITDRKWSDSAVRRILINPVYTGRLYQHTTEKASYKSSRRIRLLSEKAILFPVPRIIPDDQFTLVSEIMQKRHHVKQAGHWLCGKVFCAVCGANMHVSGDEKNGRIICSTRKRFHTCTAPSVLRKELLRIITDILIQDGIPVREPICRKLISAIRIGPEHITVCVRYRQPLRNM